MAEAKKRETTKERAERERAEMAVRQATEWLEFSAAYPARFATLMFRYMTLDYAQFRVKKVDNETYEFSREDYSYRDYVLKVTPPANYSWEYLNQLEQAEEQLADYDRQVAEQERKATVRAAALNKLTAEERELLNL
jgi:hypothetical protein